MVSPAAKGSNDIAFTASRTRSALDGDKVTFISVGAFADAPGTAAVVQYLASRGSDGWSVRPLTPAQQTDEWSITRNSAFRDFSDDLSHGAFVSGEPRPNPLAPADVRNLYVRDNVQNIFNVVTTVPPNDGMGFKTEPFYAGASSDFSHVVFESTAQLTPDALPGGVRQVYESVNGQIRLAGVLPDGSAPVGGSQSGFGAGDGIATLDNFTKRTVSDDGSLISFTGIDGGGVAHVYVRENGRTTTWVNRSQRTDCATSPGSCTGAPSPDPTGIHPAAFRDATPNGKKILFTSCEKLTDDSTARRSGSSCTNSTASPDLYQFDVDSGRLKLISVDQEPADLLTARVRGTIGQSDDGSIVYFVAARRLTTSTPAFPSNQVAVYEWDSGTLAYVGLVRAQDDELFDPNYSTGVSARVTADGGHLMFATELPQAGIDNRGMEQIYVYDAGTGQLRCASCGTRTTPALGPAMVMQQSPGVAAGTIEYNSRALLDNGSRVFFSTSDPLVAEDTNGRIDAYGYDTATGENYLISTGKSNDSSYFVDASADGRDVFFNTREQISKRDGDNNADLYDARAGGGLAEPDDPQVVPCSGDACQGTPRTPPAANDLGTRQDYPVEAPDEEPEASKRLTVAKVSRSALRTLARTGKLTLKVKLTGGGTVTALMSARINGRGRTVGSTWRTVTSRSAKTVSLTLRMSAAARRALARSGRLKATITVSSDGAKSRRTSLTITRKRG
ncbi:hypothetical protein [Conexibacter woesei]|nr:hypothetical protein [Conexibacter woesei]